MLTRYVILLYAVRTWLSRMAVYSFDKSRREQEKEMLLSIRKMSSAVRKWGDKELRSAMTEASRDAAKLVVPYVQKYVPEGPTGNLRRNIKPAGSRTIPKVRAGTKTRGGPYAWLVHGGHKTRGVGRVEPVQYMKLGIEEAYPKMYKLFVKGQRKAATLFNAKTKKAGRVKF